jgi:hypothetical protein
MPVFYYDVTAVMVGFLTGKDVLKFQPQLFEVLADRIELKE